MRIRTYKTGMHIRPIKTFMPTRKKNKADFPVWTNKTGYPCRQTKPVDWNSCEDKQDRTGGQTNPEWTKVQ